MFVVDTDVCVDALRGVRRAIDALAALETTAPLAVAAITAHELWEGAFGSRDPQATSRAVGQFLAAFEVLPYDDEVAVVGGRLAAALGAKGKPIGDLDTMIAATALFHGATLVTRNVRHFGRIPDLPIHAA